MSTPAVIVRFELEAIGPTVLADWANEAEERRLLDWLEAQPKLHALLVHALELQEEARAA